MKLIMALAVTFMFCTQSLATTLTATWGRLVETSSYGDNFKHGDLGDGGLFLFSDKEFFGSYFGASLYELKPKNSTTRDSLILNSKGDIQVANISAGINLVMPFYSFAIGPAFFHTITNGADYSSFGLYQRNTFFIPLMQPYMIVIGIDFSYVSEFKPAPTKESALFSSAFFGVAITNF